MSATYGQTGRNYVAIRHYITLYIYTDIVDILNCTYILCLHVRYGNKVIQSINQSQPGRVLELGGLFTTKSIDLLLGLTGTRAICT